MTVGIRDLKTHLSRYLKRVEAGATLRVTARGRTIATIQPAAAAPNLVWAHRMVAEGLATWSGGKPTGANKPLRLRRGSKTAADMVIEDRR